MGEDGVRNVDTMATEMSTSGEIDTSAETSPVTVLTPSSGKRISTRGVFLFTDSTSGEIEVKFPTSNITVAKVYASHFYHLTLPSISFVGAVNEGLELSWSGLSSGSKIFYVIRYKEV